MALPHLTMEHTARIAPKMLYWTLILSYLTQIHYYIPSQSSLLVYFQLLPTLADPLLTGINGKRRLHKGVSS